MTKSEREALLQNANLDFVDWCNRPAKQMTCLEEMALKFSQSIVADGPVDSEEDGYQSHIDQGFKAAINLLQRSFFTRNLTGIRKLA